MEGIIQLGQEEVNEIIKDFGIKPMFNKIIVTLNMVEDEDGIIVTDDGISETQFVIATGDRSAVCPGDKISIDISKLQTHSTSAEDQYQRTSSVQVKPVVFRDITYAIISDNVVDYIILRD